MPTVTKSRALTSATSGAKQPALKLSRYALSQTHNGIPGEHGGVALKDFPTTVGGIAHRIVRGSVIPAEVVAQWPVNNRRAMEQVKFVRYFLTPAEAAEAAAEASITQP